MGILDTVTQMKSQGKSENEIIQALQNKGVPPRDIQDALSQAQIKNAVSGNQTQNMQTSIMDQPPEPQYTQDQEGTYEAQYPQENQNYNYQDPYQDQYSQYPAQEQYPQENQNYNYQDPYQDQYPQDYSYDQSTNTNTLIEISEQVFNDKIKKLQETIEKLNEFKTLTDAKVKTMEQRLKRIESTIDQLQTSILDKVGSYGKNLNSIKKEMNMMQDSFGKVLNPFLNRKRKRL